MSHHRAFAALAWFLLAVVEQILVGLAVVAATGAAALLVAAGWWGWRLWGALRELDRRVEILESVVHAEGGG